MQLLRTSGCVHTCGPVSIVNQIMTVNLVQSGSVHSDEHKKVSREKMESNLIV